MEFRGKASFATGALAVCELFSQREVRSTRRANSLHAASVFPNAAKTLHTRQRSCIPVGLNWKSSAAANYYYGVEPGEARLGLPAYSVGSATNVFARLSMTYTLSEHWQIVSLLQYEKLASEISNSPSVEDDHVTTGYIGLYYEF